MFSLWFLIDTIISIKNKNHNIITVYQKFTFGIIFLWMTTVMFPNGLFNYSRHLIRARLLNQINPDKDLILDIRKMVWEQAGKSVYTNSTANISNNKEAKNSSRGCRTIFSGPYGFYRFHRTTDSKSCR